MSGEAMSGLIAGTHTLLVGVEDHPSGGLRLYLNHRSQGIYTVVTDPEAMEEIRSAWGGNGFIVVPVPPRGYLYEDEPTNQQAPGA